MTILFLSPSAQRGGAEAVLFEILQGLRAAKPAWTLHLILGEDGPLLEQARALGATAEVLDFPRRCERWGRRAEAIPEPFGCFGSRVSPWERAGPCCIRGNCGDALPLCARMLCIRME